MIIYQNGLTTLDYDTATDVLHMEWPDMKYFNLVDVRETLQILVKEIRNYDIKKMLLDSSKAEIDVNDPAYLEVLIEAANSLLTTRLEKLARIQTSDYTREGKVEDAKALAGPTLQVVTFPDKEAALAWLTSEA